ncbi:MAG TPA: HAD family phosphatase [Candidatus Acidoferrales bacterium]|nr:HAD family phosphatase [Candidatus Acidoferrales bacterium]
MGRTTRMLRKFKLLLKSTQRIRPIQLAIFDLDGTITYEDYWHKLHEELGTSAHSKIITDRYQNGGLSFKEWTMLEVQAWNGTPVHRIQTILDSIPYRAGAKETFTQLHNSKIRTIIVSAGLSLIADRVARQLGSELAIANELEINNGQLSGKVRINVTIDNKKEIIKQIASKLRIPLDAVALIGDSAADLPIKDCLRITYKPYHWSARQAANIVVEDDNLQALLPYLLPEQQKNS